MNKIEDVKRKLQLLEEKWSDLSYAFNKRSQRMKTMNQCDRKDLLHMQEENLRERLSLFEQKTELAMELDALKEENK